MNWGDFMKPDFGKALIKTLKYEGGYAFDDLGGETYRGISRRYHPDWPGWVIIDRLKDDSGKPIAPEADTTLEQSVRFFYESEYWEGIAGDNLLDQSIAEEVFDTSVFMGRGRAAEFLQRGLNALNKNRTLYVDLEVDSYIGPKTIGCLSIYLECQPPSFLLAVVNCLQGAYLFERMAKSPEQEKWVYGWLKRVQLAKVN